VRFYVLFSDITATSIVAIALTALLLSSSPLPSSFSFHTNTNRDHLAFASPSISGSQTTVQVPPPPSSPSPQYPTLDTESTQSSQSQSGEGSGPSSDNFNLPTGYIIEPFLENLSMPTSIALNSENGTIYVAESINEYEGDNNSSILTSSSPHPGSFLSQQPQVRIVKAEISGDNDTIVNQTLDHSGGGISDNDNDKSSTIINTDLKWPVIDMEVDDTTSLLYALHDRTTISTINTTSGERADIFAREEVEQPAAAAVNDKYQEEQQDPLSFLINSSSQIVLSGNEDYYDSHRDRGEAGSNPDSYNFTTMLYMPCMNGDADNNNSGIYCILGLPIDRNGNSAIVDNIDSINSSSSFILGNMTSRPVGIAILNSSLHAATSSSFSSPSSSSSSPSSVSEQNSYPLTGSQTSNALFNNVENDLLIITSQPPSNSSIFSNTNNDNNNEQNRSSNHNPRQQAQPPSMEAIADYPYGQLGQVAVVSVPSSTATISSSSSSSSSANETTKTNQIPSIEEDNLSTYSSPPPFGLNETTAFIADFGNSSAYGAALNLPKIIMLDVQTGDITPFLALKYYDPSFTPIDIAFDYNNSALYVLSTGNNQEEDTNNNTTNDTNNLINTGSLNNNSNGIVWKISYQGEEQEAATSSNNSSSINNSTDNNNDNTDNATSSLTTPPPSSSSNDTDSSNNSTDSSSDDSNGLDDESSSYDEDEEDTDDDSIGTDNSSSNSEEDTEDNSDSDSTGSSSPGDSSSPPPPSTQPVNAAPIAEDDTATTDQDTPVVIDVLVNDVDKDDEDSLSIDSVDEQSVQGGNVKVIISSGGSDEEDGDNDNNDGGGKTNEKIEYTPAEGFFGNDEFTYAIVDANGATDSATVTVTVNEVILTPHPTSYWLENEDGITQVLLEKAAEDHDKWSFNLGNFRVPVKFDISDNENDTKGILEGAEGNGNNNNDDDDDVNDNTNVYDQLAAQLLAVKLNIENGISTCESIETTIENTNTVLINARYRGPGTTETPTGESRDYASELIEVLDKYNINGCV
jgi:hypothetical protein